jgi:hypothetical protein
MILGVRREAIQMEFAFGPEVSGKSRLTRRISTDKKCQMACGFLAESLFPEVHDPKLLC